MDTAKTVRIVGVGNRHRRDDGVGLTVAERI
jgi:Ni,Fe-hydrogenase maturation factor